MKILISHPTGNQNVRAVITALAEKKMLASFITTLAADPNSQWLAMLPNSIRQEWLRRKFPVSSKEIKTFPRLELTRTILRYLRIEKYTKHEVGWASVDAVYQNLDQNAANYLTRFAKKKNINAVYAYEDGALATFTQAKALGLTCIYDLPIAYWQTSRKLMFEESERLPNWAPTLGGGIRDSPAKLERKTHELELADVIISPGAFVIDSLPEWAYTKQVIVAPFGSPKINSINKQVAVFERPLRILFAGSLSQRKGLSDLFTAIKLLNCSHIELVVMGSLQAPIEFYKSELSTFTYEPSRPHEQVLALMRSCDVLCLPSIVEGRALVMQEAMSQGLPLIITPNTGGEDLVKEGETGFLIPIRSPELIAEKLAWFLENRSKIPEMGKMAQEHASKYTWEKYGSIITKALMA